MSGSPITTISVLENVMNIKWIIVRKQMNRMAISLKEERFLVMAAHEENCFNIQPVMMLIGVLEASDFCVQTWKFKCKVRIASKL